MWVCRWFAALVVCAFAGSNAFAAAVAIDVVDKNGTPVPDAVVSLAPETPSAIPSHLPDKAVIDQRNEMFLPLVVIVRKGGRVVFTNNDVTMHQVYSFSAIKQFQFVIKQGEQSAPVSFEQAGVAAIGCNIHDQMIAYVFVGDMPFGLVTDAKGHASLGDVPAGRYRLASWHPQLPIGTPVPEQELAVTDAGASLTVTLPFAIPGMREMKHMHMDY